MIYIDRNSVNIPSILNSNKTKAEIRRMGEFFLKKERQKQIRYEFRNYYAHREVKDALKTLFHGKCAYCERQIDKSDLMVIDNFRPKVMAMNLDGKIDESHYWWVAYDWNNLYPSCSVCNQSKRTRFPVEGKRVNYLEDLSKEKSLLLDPGNKSDFADQHFSFTEWGEIIGLTDRGQATIEVLNLNRMSLQLERAQVIEQIKVLIKTTASIKEQDKAFDQVQKVLLEQISPSAPHSLVANYFIRSYYKTHGEDKPIKGLWKTLKILFQEISITDLAISVLSLIESSKPIVKELQSSYNINLESQDEKKAYFSSAKRIRKIEIDNFKIIKSLKLDFPRPKSIQEAWMVLLGENGTGKSTVLQAIALTLAGSRNANKLGLNAADFVNRHSRKRTGFVKIYLEGIDEFIELRFSKSSNKFDSNFPDPKVIIMAFGSTRLMASKEKKIFKDSLINLRNLFDPYAALPNIENWIGDPNQVNVHQFDKIAVELKKLLQLHEDNLIYRRKTPQNNHELFIKVIPGNQGIRLKELSAGYQVILVLTINIIREVLKTWDDFSLAEGIVIIDEIGVHLHPRWKMQIIRTLREIFPAMTFIVTTHEPLCLRGVNEGEVVLMKYDENKEVIALTDLPSPNSLTVEQLITSKFFGLVTSFDPEVEVKLNTYYALKAKIDRTESEKKQLEELENDLVQRDIIDDQSNMNMKKESIDISWVSSPVRQEELKNKIKSIWEEDSSGF